MDTVQTVPTARGEPPRTANGYPKQDLAKRSSHSIPDKHRQGQLIDRIGLGYHRSCAQLPSAEVKNKWQN